MTVGVQCQLNSPFHCWKSITSVRYRNQTVTTSCCPSPTQSVRVPSLLVGKDVNWRCLHNSIQKFVPPTVVLNFRYFRSFLAISIWKVRLIRNYSCCTVLFRSLLSQVECVWRLHPLKTRWQTHQNLPVLLIKLQQSQGLKIFQLWVSQAKSNL